MCGARSRDPPAALRYNTPMTCPKCGAVGDGPVCATCGTAFAVAASEFPATVVAARTSGMAIAGFVCSFFCGVLGVVFSAIGRNECKRSRGTIKGEGLALAGIIISIVQMAVMFLGILAAVAIPAFMDYMSKSKTTEAIVELRQLGHAAQAYYTATGKFPVGSAPLTPAQPCCTGTNGKCPATPADWMTPAWQPLDFQIDHPHHYQYSYTSDGNTFQALAVGDLDCDTVMVTYTLNIDSAGRSTVSGPSNPD